MPIQPEPFDDATLPYRFFNLKQVAAMLATSEAQVYALVRNGDLPAIKIGGRGQWRVDSAVLDHWVDGQYEKTRKLTLKDLSTAPCEAPTIGPPHPPEDSRRD